MRPLVPKNTPQDFERPTRSELAIRRTLSRDRGLKSAAHKREHRGEHGGVDEHAPSPWIRSADQHCGGEDTCDNLRVLPTALRALIFDMDGLMVDSEPLWWRVEYALAEAHGITWTDELALSCVGGGLPNVIRTMQGHGLSVNIDAGVTFLVETFMTRISELELKPGCLELIDAGRNFGLRLAVASSSTANLIEKVLARFELRSHFDVVVSGEAVTHAKPAPDIFLVAAEKLGVAAREAVVLEDSIAGVHAANAANIAVIAVPEFDRERFASLTPHVLADLHEARVLLGL